MTDNDITIRSLAGIEPAVIHKAFLEASGFDLACRQYEMTKKLI